MKNRNFLAMFLVSVLLLMGIAHAQEYWAVYADTDYPSSWITVSETNKIVAYLTDPSRGFEKVNAKELKAFMEENDVDSVVVMAQDIVPDTVVDSNSPSSNSVIKDYMNRGGRVVWLEDTPFYYVGHKGGKKSIVGDGGQLSVLGIQVWFWDKNKNDEIHISSSGIVFGLTQTWKSARPSTLSSSGTALASAEGGAAAYHKNFNSAYPGSGFVRIWDNSGEFTSDAYLKDLYMVATHVSAKTEPGTYVTLIGTSGNNGWYTSDVKIVFACTDTESGCSKVEYCIDKENTCAPNALYTSEIKISNEGANYLRYRPAKVSDATVKSTEVKIDKTKPSASIAINNNDELTNSRNVALSLSYSDAVSGVDKCRYKNQAEDWSEWQACSNTKSWTLSSGSGTKEVSYKVMDKAGKVKLVDDTINLKSPPVLNSILPSSQFVKFGDSLVISSEVSDEDRDVIRLECGSATQASDLCKGGYAYTAPSCTFAISWKDDSTHTIYCRAYDGSLHSNEKTVAVVSDNTKPAASIDSPSASAWFRNDFTVQYDATDANIDFCSVATKDSGGQWEERTNKCGDNQQLTVTAGNNKNCFTQGKDTCSVKVYGKDKVGEENEVSRSFSIDFIPPVVNSLSHSPDLIIEETGVTIKAEASDPLGELANIEIYVDSQLKHTCSSSPCLYISKYTRGVHSYHAKAADKAGNEQTSSVQSFKVLVAETLPIKKGWNLVSMPYKVFTFVSSSCDPGRSFHNYDTVAKAWNVLKHVKDLQSGKGYWAYADKECAVKIIGQQEALSSDVRLATGWNQIGSPSSEPNFASVKGGCRLESILEFDALIANWKSLGGSDKLEKYKGYFVDATC